MPLDATLRQTEFILLSGECRVVGILERRDSFALAAMSTWTAQ
jgi:hypothetical protein